MRLQTVQKKTIFLRNTWPRMQMMCIYDYICVYIRIIYLSYTADVQIFLGSEVQWIIHRYPLGSSAGHEDCGDADQWREGPCGCHAGNDDRWFGRRMSWGYKPKSAIYKWDFMDFPGKPTILDTPVYGHRQVTRRKENIAVESSMISATDST